MSYSFTWAMTTGSHAEGSHVLGCSCSTSDIWEEDGEVPSLKPVQWNSSQSHTDPSGLFYILWDGVKWHIIIAFYIYPFKYSPGHHKEGSTNYSYKINLWKCFMSWFWWWVTRVYQICHLSNCIHNNLSVLLYVNYWSIKMTLQK